MAGAGAQLRGAGEGALERSLDTLARGDLGTKPYRSIAGDAATGLLILCDHAENTLPEAYGCLGLRQEDLHRHIAYDMGAAGVAERLAKMLGAPALLSQFSRLLIDPNRGLDDPTLIMRLSVGPLTAQVLQTTTSALTTEPTRTCPASARQPAKTCPSAKFVEHPKLLMKTFIALFRR